MVDEGGDGEGFGPEILECGEELFARSVDERNTWGWWMRYGRL